MRAARRHGATPQALLLLALASTLLLQPAAAIYADQAGQYDWLQQHVGAVSLARFAAGGGSGGSLVVASAASGTLASLAPADGSIRWRRVLSDGDAVTALLVAVDHVLTLSDAGRKLQAWDLASGAALWAADLPAGSSGGDLAVLRDADVVLASLPGTVKVRACAAGRVALVACCRQQWQLLIGRSTDAFRRLTVHSCTCRALACLMARRSGAWRWPATRPACLRGPPTTHGPWRSTGEKRPSCGLALQC